MSLQDSHQISDVKVMLVKGIDGNGIASIEKTSSEGLVDVYTITYTNGERSTFTVTNGAGGGMSALIIISSEAGSDVSVTAPSGRSLNVEQVSGSSTLWQCETTEYGTHYIDSVLSGEDAQVSLNVDVCKIYTIDDTHFSADITVTYPEGATCSCGKSGETPAYATDNPYTFTVHSADTYIITVNNGILTKTENVVISTSGQEETLNISLVPDGATITPTDDIATWLYCADIWDKNYTTIGEVLADSTTFSALVADTNAVNYMVRSTTWATTVCSNQSAMQTIGLNNYASDSLIADNTWMTAIGSSSYFTKILNFQNPAMTSATTPSGTVTVSNNNASYPAWKAFDKSEGTGWNQYDSPSSQWIEYTFPTSQRICMAKMKADGPSGGNNRWSSAYIKAGSAYKTISANIASYYNKQAIIFTDRSGFTNYRLQTTLNMGAELYELYLYGRVDV